MQEDSKWNYADNEDWLNSDREILPIPTWILSECSSDVVERNCLCEGYDRE